MSAQRQTHHGPRRSSTPQAPRELLKSPALICGLGNPGEKYAHTRHNIGFAVIDALARRYDVRYWKSEAGCQTALITVTGSSGLTGSSAQSPDGQKREVLLAKPQDFMNTSGGPSQNLPALTAYFPLKYWLFTMKLILKKAAFAFAQVAVSMPTTGCVPSLTN